MADYLLEPEDHSKDDYIREKVEERMTAFAEMLDELDLPQWFDSYIDWTGIEKQLWGDVDEEIQQAIDDQAIERWEERQRDNENLW